MATGIIHLVRSQKLTFPNAFRHNPKLHVDPELNYLSVFFVSGPELFLSFDDKLSYFHEM